MDSRFLRRIKRVNTGFSAVHETGVGEVALLCMKRREVALSCLRRKVSPLRTKQGKVGLRSELNGERSGCSTMHGMGEGRLLHRQEVRECSLLFCSENKARGRLLYCACRRRHAGLQYPNKGGGGRIALVCKEKEISRSSDVHEKEPLACCA